MRMVTCTAVRAKHPFSALLPNSTDPHSTSWHDSNFIKRRGRSANRCRCGGAIRENIVTDGDIRSARRRSRIYVIGLTGHTAPGYGSGGHINYTEKRIGIKWI